MYSAQIRAHHPVWVLGCWVDASLLLGVGWEGTEIEVGGGGLTQ